MKKLTLVIADLAISTVAQRVGFSNARSMSAVFRQWTVITPSDFAERPQAPSSTSYVGQTF